MRMRNIFSAFVAGLSTSVSGSHVIYQIWSLLSRQCSELRFSLGQLGRHRNVLYAARVGGLFCQHMDLGNGDIDKVSWAKYCQ